ncbi:MAG: hypothetical protein JW881_10545 [Spirochaetales bacterium]|nr:hypothetical protein [Spirochaetales bacterium]
MRRLSILVLIMSLVATLSFGADNDAHDVTMIVAEVFEVVLSDGSDVTLTINAATPGEQVTDATPDSSQDLHYTSLVDSGTYHKITAAATSGGNFAPAGTELTVVAVIQAGGAGSKGSEEAELTLADDSTLYSGDLITDIGSCYTGILTTNGAELTYSLNVEDAASLVTDAGKTVTVTYTMVDQ